MKLTPYTKTEYKVAQSPVTVTIESGTPIIRTGSHFHKYYTTKVVEIPAGTEFSIYNATREDVVIDVPGFDLLPNAAVEFSDKQYIGTGKIRSGEERFKVFDKFYEYYTGLGYEIFTTDSDHEIFNRSVFRNICAAVFPQEIMILLDGDAFFTKDQLDKAVEYARLNDKIVRPTDLFAFAQVPNDFDPYHLLEHMNTAHKNFVKEDTDWIDTEKYNYYLGTRLCAGGWVLRPHLWVGMDERLSGWGGEDTSFDRCINLLYLVESLSNGVMVSVDHDNRDYENTTKNLEMIEVYFDPYNDPVQSRTAAVLEDLLIRYAGYKTYGRFAQWPR